MACQRFAAARLAYFSKQANFSLDPRAIDCVIYDMASVWVS